MSMDANSMIGRRGTAGPIAMTIRSRLQSVSIGRIVVIAAAFFVQAILILGFVAMSLGLGAEGHAGVGPDRPPSPVSLP
jgi:hypothetical protein